MSVDCARSGAPGRVSAGEALAAPVAHGRPGGALAAWALAGLAGIALWLALPSWSWLTAGPPVCAMREVFHVGCPTCGFSRALASLARGDLGASLMWHPLALPIVAQLGALWLAWGVGLIRRRPLLRGRWIAGAVAANAIAALVIWAIRLATGTLPV